MSEANYSIEILPSLVLREPGLPATLEGLEVFIPLLDRNGRKAQLEAAALLARRGAIPVPHIVARNLLDERELRDTVDAFSTAGCRRFLLLAGGATEPQGNLPDSIALLDRLSRGSITRCQRLYFAAHPDGLEGVSEDVLLEALRYKEKWCVLHGIDSCAVTQFRLSPNTPERWRRGLRRSGIDIPVRLGVAGPCDTRRLLRYARRCGLLNAGRGARVLLPHLPGLMLGWKPLPPARLDAAWAGVHIYPFGGVEDALAWAKEN